MKYYIYFETLILSILFLYVYTPIRNILGYVIDRLVTLHQTADFYSAYNIRFWQAGKAREKYDELYNEAIKEMLKDKK